MDNRYKIGTVVFGNWTITREIGKGSFGKVFEIGRDDFGEHYSAALKVISVPRDNSEAKAMLADGMTAENTAEYFYSIVEDIVKEFAIMSKLKGTTNIVSYEDHQVVQHSDGLGWDILIRMELLSTLGDYFKEQPMTYRAACQLGIDICRALERCEKHRIVHRDIKPENIFVSRHGDFVLGDFGVARTMERATSGSIKGTYNYMAPEVYRGTEYDHRVDFYSLGVVLYKYFNNNRFPFLPLDQTIKYQDTEAAFIRRMSGETFMPPANAPLELGQIILKACAFRAEDRYAKAADLRAALESVMHLLPNEPLGTVAFAGLAVHDINPDDTELLVDEGTVMLDGGSGTVAMKSEEVTRVHGSKANTNSNSKSKTPAVPFAIPEKAAPSNKKKNKSIVPVVIGCSVVALGAVAAALYMLGGDGEQPSDFSDSYGIVEVAKTTDAPSLTSPDAVTDAVPVATTEKEVAATTAEPAVSLPSETVFDDGSKEIYTYNSENKIKEMTMFDTTGAFVARVVFEYRDGNLLSEKQYDAEAKLISETVVASDGSKQTLKRTYKDGAVSGSTKTVYDANGNVTEVHTLNKYDGVEETKFYDANGKVKLTRKYHYTTAGYENGYTDTDASGKKVRYNQDGSVYKEPEKTTKATTVKTEPIVTQATTAATTKQQEPAKQTRTEKVTALIDNVYEGDTLVAQITYLDETHWRMKVYDDKVKRIATEYDWSSGSKVTLEERKYDFYGHVTMRKQYNGGTYAGRIEYEYYDDIGRIKVERHYDAHGILTQTIENKIITNKNGSYYIKDGRYVYSRWVNGKEESRMNYWYVK